MDGCIWNYMFETLEISYYERSMSPRASVGNIEVVAVCKSKMSPTQVRPVETYRSNSAGNFAPGSDEMKSRNTEGLRLNSPLLSFGSTQFSTLPFVFECQSWSNGINVQSILTDILISGFRCSL